MTPSSSIQRLNKVFTQSSLLREEGYLNSTLRRVIMLKIVVTVGPKKPWAKISLGTPTTLPSWSVAQSETTIQTSVAHGLQHTRPTPLRQPASSPANDKTATTPVTLASALTQAAFTTLPAGFPVESDLWEPAQGTTLPRQSEFSLLTDHRLQPAKKLSTKKGRSSLAGLAWPTTRKTTCHHSLAR
ncbi:hypothetical protein OsI_19791 [Oryza sativa Indica Group]|uniref:Uncharacterized protein n=1 Tax=Oryza sativa subsp. indica TaxID=39946 RepID=B8AXT0_ORYSI|nr:hypothetical protein OsI_19791 [Oryza sativa Indica Group]